MVNGDRDPSYPEPSYSDLIFPDPIHPEGEDLDPIDPDSYARDPRISERLDFELGAWLALVVALLVATVAFFVVFVAYGGV